MSNDDWSGLADVEFDFGAASALQSAATNAASAVQGSVDTISRTSATALAEFNGHFADIFRSNVTTAKVDGQNIVTCLQALARYSSELISAARAENRRRAHARAWLEERRALRLADSALPNIPDEPMPYDLDETGPSYSVDDVALRSRSAPVRGAAGGGTSSAAPESLRAFSSQAGASGMGFGSFGFGGTTNLTSLWGDFLAGCRWGRLTDGGVAAAVGKWFSANSEDMLWIATVADAFEAAGGTGGSVSTVSNSALGDALRSAGVSEVRLTIEVSAPTLQGVVPTTGYSNDPVNTATGNFIEPETDLVFGGIASALSFSRMYNSMDETIGSFGVGWASVFDSRLELSDEGAVFVMPDGRHLTFPRSGRGWGRAENANFWLVRQPASQHLRKDRSTTESLIVRDNAGRWWAFTPSGTCLEYGAGSGTTVALTRDELGQVVSLDHEHGRSVTVVRSGERVREIRASDGRSVRYEYDGAGRLLGVTSETGTRSYRWNDAGWIDRVVSEAGVVECENLYDARGRVMQQITEFGRVVRFAYLPGRVTAISDHDGKNSNTWIADRKGRLVGVVDALDQRQSMSYDAHGNLVTATERDGSITTHLYDDRGRRVRTVTPEGADRRTSYDELDRVVETRTGGDAVTRFEYTAEEDRFPSKVVDPEGGVTRLIWEHGLLRKAVDPAGVVTRFGYDGYGDLVSVIDAVGNTARLIRDEAGRVTETLSPAGHRTRWEYDAAGNVIQRVDADGASWRYEYGLGRKLAAVVDPCGARTEYAYGVHGDLTRVIDPLGRTTQQRFDSNGNPAAVVLPDGAEWLLQHDGLSRLLAVTDPDGGVWSREYDQTGRITSVEGPTGVRQEFSRDRVAGIETMRTAFTESVVQYDAFGHPVTVTRPDGGESIMVYDRCGRVVEEIDAEGGLTRVERDMAGRVVQFVTPAGRKTRYEYDECGRPSVMVDGLGRRIELTYNADSQVISRCLPNGDVATVEYDPMGRVVVERIPGHGVSRYRYDLAGRIVFAQDSKYGVRRFAYDRAGQLVSAINGLGGKTTYTYDDLGRVVSVTDPVGGVTRREYTALHRVQSITDALDRTTTGTYNAAGSLLSQVDPDGRELRWEYDAEGRVCETRTKDRVLATSILDYRSCTEEVSDSTRPGGGEVVQRMVRDRLGRLVKRSRDAETTTWEYDADGLRTGMRTPSGDEVSYAYDTVGRVVRVTHSAFGEISYEYDGAGNLLTAAAGDATQSWTYRDGYTVGYQRSDADGVLVTRIDRDADGRIVRIEAPEGWTGYEYDDAGQLLRIEASEGTAQEWTYDLSGRLVRERAADQTIRYRYDDAGQLLVRSSSLGEETRYRYDGAGRRVLESGPAGERAFAWDERGWLTAITDNDGHQSLWVDALGELSEVGAKKLVWDTAAAFPALTGVADGSVISAPGFVGTDAGWEPTGWRPARQTSGSDPWTLLGVSMPGLGGASDVGMTTHGTPTVGGLEWMGARLYDPAVRGFLSVDPSPPVVGAGWAGNPYSYAGNDPVHALDPHGLSPITDSELFDFQDPLGNLDPFWLLRNHQYVRAYEHNWGEFSRGDWAREPFWQWTGNILNVASTVTGIAALAVMPTPLAVAAPELAVFSFVTGIGSAVIELAATPESPTSWVGGALALLGAIPFVRVIKLAEPISNSISIGSFHWGMVSSIGKTGELLTDDKQDGPK